MQALSDLPPPGRGPERAASRWALLSPLCVSQVKLPTKWLLMGVERTASDVALTSPRKLQALTAALADQHLSLCPPALASFIFIYLNGIKYKHGVPCCFPFQLAPFPK